MFLNNSLRRNNIFLSFQSWNESIWKISTKTIQTEAGNQHIILVEATEAWQYYTHWEQLYICPHKETLNPYKISFS